MSEYVSYEYADGVAWITLDDAEHGNAIHPAMIAELHDAVRRSTADRARVIVLQARGKFFSVGGDLGAFAAAPGADNVSVFIDDLAEAIHRVVLELVQNEAIVVSVVQGTAAGAGFPLAASADVVIAAASAKFTLGYTKVGLSVDGGTSLLVHSLGLHRALRLALLNDVLSAAEAQAAGLVARVLPDDELAAGVQEVVGRLVSGPAAALAATKRLLRTTADPAPERALRAETRSIRDRAGEPDGREGVLAFVEKRAPRFG
ncbi:MAG: enoyl-CoA hydratase [Marmoricola sp.]|nr:enoyl-CoA hydratase [Marmoricola sp.]